MRPVSKLSLIALLAPFAMPAAAYADTTAAQAQSLEQQVNSWMAGSLGKLVTLPDRAVQFTPQGDGYRVAVPLGSTGGTLTALAHALDGGRWDVSEIRFPSPLKFTMDLRDLMRGAGKLLPSDQQNTNFTYTATLADQTGHAVFDPSFATPSTLEMSYGALDLQAQSPRLNQSTHMEHYDGTLTLRPGAAGHIDAVTDASAQNYTLTSQLENGHTLHLTMDKLHVSGGIDGLNRDQAAKLVQGLIEMATSARTAPAPASGQHDDSDKLSPANKAALHTFLLSLQDVVSGLHLQEDIQGIHVAYDKQQGGAALLRVGMHGDAPQGVLNTRLDFVLDGLDIPALPPGPMHDLIPSKIAFSPTLSGIGVHELYALALSATEPDGQPNEAEAIATLFSHGGITAGLNDVALQIGQTLVQGAGVIVAASPADVHGQARVTATKLDVLIQQAQSMPDLAQAVPVLLLLKGLARTEGETSVWDVSWEGNKLLVNGVDVQKMFGGAHHPPRPGQRPGRNTQHP